MITPTDLEITSLPQLPLEFYPNLPAIPALYFCTSQGDILYIGITKNLNARWRAHHKIYELCQYPEVLIHWLDIDADRLTLDLEQAFIQHWEPKLNQNKLHPRTPHNVPPNFDKYQVGFLDISHQQNFLCHVASTLNIKKRTYQIALYLSKKANPNGIVVKTVAEIVEETGFSKPTVLATLQAMEKHEIIQRKTGVIFLNPNVIFKGSANSRKALVIEYLNFKSNSDD